MILLGTVGFLTYKLRKEGKQTKKEG